MDNLSGLTAENTLPSSLSVSWDPVQTVKRGERIEYLLQSQCVGKDQDFLEVSFFLLGLNVLAFDFLRFLIYNQEINDA